MLRWLFKSSTDKSFDDIMPEETQSARDDDRKNLDCTEDFLFLELVVAEVEMAVVEFEIEQDLIEEAARKTRKGPDYSWLADKSQKPKKYLSSKEKNRIENACDRLKPCEWSKTIENWKKTIKNASSRDNIIDQFIHSTHETLQTRKHDPTISEVLKNYATGKSMSSVKPGGNESPRSIAQLSIFELQQIV
ncbi:unnamed protein product [Caenorhabditis angaria]|uniref:Uncharacterized protein n=1 Tax=Caenorhabditis angaria TaxID=860376 RepID=A0A9P1INB6_9PELO|nr:unnamed protein product [Caenorhabditis angaria]